MTLKIKWLLYGLRDSLTICCLKVIVGVFQRDYVLLLSLVSCMAVLLISYDLNFNNGRPEESDKYKRVIAKIASLGDSIMALKSVALVRTSSSVTAAHEAIYALLDPNDRMIVVDVTGAERFGWLDKDVIAWISSNW